MERYCDGDAAAFQELYRLVAPRILSYFLRMARERALAEDLLQMTFLKIHKARSAYVRGAEPMPWIYAIAHRTFLDEMRKRQRARVTLGDDNVPEPAARIDGQAVDAQDEPRHDSELYRAALDALAQLPEKQREAVVLTKLDGKSIAEAAAITGTTPGAMKVRAHRGYEALRKALATIGVS